MNQLPLLLMFLLPLLFAYATKRHYNITDNNYYVCGIVLMYSILCILYMIHYHDVLKGLSTFNYVYLIFAFIFIILSITIVLIYVAHYACSHDFGLKNTIINGSINIIFGTFIYSFATTPNMTYYQRLFYLFMIYILILIWDSIYAKMMNKENPEYKRYNNFFKSLAVLITLYFTCK